MRLTFFIACAFHLTGLNAQPTWRFHLAFENGDGARDTIWLVYDTTATIGSDFDPEVDTLLGEGAVEMDPNVFNVWMYNWDYDSTKTIAWPYSQFPSLETGFITATQWQEPVTIRWDTAMFHSPYLPGSDSIGLARMDGTYFFFFNNDPLLQAYNLLLDHSVVVTANSDLLFPLAVLFDAVNDIGLAETNTAEAFVVWPNPLSEGPLHIHNGAFYDIQLFDQLGQSILGPIGCHGLCVIEHSFITPGCYLLRAVTSQNQVYHAKLIK